MEEKKVDPVLDGIEFSINHFAGATIRNKVFEGKTLEEVSAYSPREKAKWVKGAMERLDALVDKEKRCQLMKYCGAMCAGAVGRRFIVEAKERRKKYKTIDEFLKADGVAREGDILYTTYTPHKDGKRCYCLGNDLPAEETMSPTYCHCAAGHVEVYWEEVLERPVKVELAQSAISGAQDCRFAVHLVEKVPQEFKCKVCGWTFKTSKELEKHIAVARASGAFPE